VRIDVSRAVLVEAMMISLPLVLNG